MPKTVLITGAGSGFGRGAAIELARRGHKLIAAVLNDQQARELAKAEPKLTVVKIDITDAKDIPKVDEWNLDAFIANAAMGQTGPLSLIPLERLRAVFEVNVFGTLDRKSTLNSSHMSISYAVFCLKKKITTDA